MNSTGYPELQQQITKRIDNAMVELNKAMNLQFSLANVSKHKIDYDQIEAIKDARDTVLNLVQNRMVLDRLP